MAKLFEKDAVQACTDFGFEIPIPGFMQEIDFMTPEIIKFLAGLETEAPDLGKSLFPFFLDLANRMEDYSDNVYEKSAADKLLNEFGLPKFDGAIATWVLLLLKEERAVKQMRASRPELIRKRQAFDQQLMHTVQVLIAKKIEELEKEELARQSAKQEIAEVPEDGGRTAAVKDGVVNLFDGKKLHSQKETNRLKKLTGKLRDFSSSVRSLKIGDLAPKSFDADEVLRQIA